MPLMWLLLLIVWVLAAEVLITALAVLEIILSLLLAGSILWLEYHAQE